MAVGRDGNLYVTEGFNSTIRKITAAGVADLNAILLLRHGAQ
ncbi:MAG TPA: hypothetical protein VFD36_06130 [Kofleriaceae bacterium]|nr:hypothetical protein [Kofleriaceae bacterium]